MKSTPMTLLVWAQVLPATTIGPNGPGESMVTMKLRHKEGDQSSAITESPLIALTLSDARTLASDLLSAATQAEDMQRTGPLQ